MSETGTNDSGPKWPLIDGLARRAIAVRWALIITALVVAGFWLIAEFDPLIAILGFAAVAVALLTSAGELTPMPSAVGQKGEADEDDPFAGYAAVVDGLPDPCFLIDGAGNVSFENIAARNLFGGVEIGQPIRFLLRAPEVSEAIHEALATGNSASVTFFDRIPADRWFEARVSPLGNTGPDQPVARGAMFLVLLRDLTEAQRVERMRVDFVANASHELRTPLASLIGFIETLQGPARDDADARERFLQVMVEQARRMSRLIDDLMSLSRIELKVHVRPETVIDIVPILAHVADSMHPLAAESDVEIKLDSGDRPLLVVGDRDELAQVFQNLVHNAIKYGQSGGRVDVVAAREVRDNGKPDGISVSVRDYGQGIEAEHLPRLTERFYRVDAETSREKGGTGLGLAIVKHILNRHRGRIVIDSKVGEGAEFRVLLESADSVVEVHNPQATT